METHLDSRFDWKHHLRDFCFIAVVSENCGDYRYYYLYYYDTEFDSSGSIPMKLLTESHDETGGSRDTGNVYFDMVNGLAMTAFKNIRRQQCNTNRKVKSEKYEKSKSSIYAFTNGVQVPTDL